MSDEGSSSFICVVCVHVHAFLRVRSLTYFFECFCDSANSIFLLERQMFSFLQVKRFPLVYGCHRGYNLSHSRCIFLERRGMIYDNH